MAGAVASTRPLAASASVAEPMIALDQGGGDVWAWETRLTGTCSSWPDNAVCAFRVDDDLVPAERDGDRFSAVVRFHPGENRVVALASVPDGPLTETAPVVHMVRLQSRPTARIAMSIGTDTVELDARGSEVSDFDDAEIVGYRWTMVDTNPSLIELGSGGPFASVLTPSIDGTYAVSLTVEDRSGRSDTAASCFVVENGVVRIPDSVIESPAWIAPATVYGVIPRLFGQPPLQRVTARLDELAELGVSALWLSPINTTIPNYFGYEVKDYFNVRADYGTLDDVRELVIVAHARGLRVLMDVVPNHTSAQHPYFVDARANGPGSRYFDFYERNETGGPTNYFDWTHLPNLNYDNPEVRRFMTEAFNYWVREIGIDGFRVDVAWGVKERRPDYWRKLSAELKRIKPDLLLIAEASARDPSYVANGFDAAYDWTDDLGHWAWGEAFARLTPIGDAMETVLTNDGIGYPPDSLVFRFLNNNDTGPRLVSRYGLGFYRVALAMLLTLPGLPCVYTGDETGAEYEPYSQLEPLDWTDRHGLRDYVKQLIALRRDNLTLHSREWMRIDAEPSLPLFVYLRFTSAGDAPPILVVLNFSATAVDAAMWLPPNYAEFAPSGIVTDLMTDERLPVAGAEFSIPVPAWGVRIVVSS